MFQFSIFQSWSNIDNKNNLRVTINEHKKGQYINVESYMKLKKLDHSYNLVTFPSYNYCNMQNQHVVLLCSFGFIIITINLATGWNRADGNNNILI